MTTDTLALSKIDEAWNGFLSDILEKGQYGQTITARFKLRIPKESYSWIIILQEASETVYIISTGMSTKLKVDSHFFNA